MGEVEGAVPRGSGAFVVNIPIHVSLSEEAIKALLRDEYAWWVRYYAHCSHGGALAHCDQRQRKIGSQVKGSCRCPCHEENRR